MIEMLVPVDSMKVWSKIILENFWYDIKSVRVFDEVTKIINWFPYLIFLAG